MRPMFAEHAFLPSGWAAAVRIEEEAGLIARIEPDAPAHATDERVGIAVPGVPNLHSHAFQRGMAGLSERRTREDDDFWSWREIMYHFLDRMDPDDVEAIAALAYVEMLESGFTRVGEFHYLHHAPDGRPYADPAEMSVRIAAAAAATGIRLTLLPCFYAHGGFGGLAPSPGQIRFLHDLDRFAALLDRGASIVTALPGATLGVAPHSLRAVTPDELRAVLGMAADRPVHIHAAEQVREVEDCVAWSGLRPVEWLLENATPDERWCVIHATHMTGAEIAALAATGAVAGLCPLTESSLGDGIFEGPDWRRSGGKLGIGTDSNIEIGAAAELRQLEYAQRLGRRGRNLMADHVGCSTAESLLRAALGGGATALSAPTSELAVGAPADILALDAGSARFAGATDENRLDCWVFGGGGQAVESVWVAGEKLVSGGRHRDGDRIRKRYRLRLRALMDR